MFSSKFLFDILQEAEERNEEDTTSGTSKSGKRQNSRPVDLDPHGKKLLQVPSKLSMFISALKSFGYAMQELSGFLYVNSKKVISLICVV